jgi:hypothetical protein
VGISEWQVTHVPAELASQASGDWVLAMVTTRAVHQCRPHLLSAIYARSQAGMAKASVLATEWQVPQQYCSHSSKGSCYSRDLPVITTDVKSHGNTNQWSHAKIRGGTFNQASSRLSWLHILRWSKSAQSTDALQSSHISLASFNCVTAVLQIRTCAIGLGRSRARSSKVNGCGTVDWKRRPCLRLALAALYPWSE